MTVFKEILLPVDLSESARVACYHAAGLASQFGATITVFHVDEISTYGFHGSEALAEYVGCIEQMRTKWLREAEAIFKSVDVKHRVVTTFGTASKEILQHAANNKVDLILMGRHGESGARRVLMGSTTKRVVRRAKVPVLVVPWREADGVPSEAVRYQHFLVTTDFSTDSQHGLSLALELAEEVDARLTLFHVADVPPVASVPGEPPYWLPNETVESLRLECERRLGELVETFATDRISFTALVSTSVAGSIIEAAETLAADLIVVPTHGKGMLQRFFVGSTTTRVLRLSGIPLLVLPRFFLNAEAGVDEDEDEGE